MEQNDDLIVNFKDLFFSILYSWKRLLVVAIACGVLLGGFQGIRKWKSQPEDADFETYQVECEQYENGIAQKQKEIASTEQKIKDAEMYLKNSVLMNVDYHKVYKATRAYYIDTNYQIQPNSTYQDTDHTSTLITYYKYYLETYSLYEAIAEDLGIETRYLLELVNLVIDGERGLYITVTHYDDTIALQIINALAEEMYAVQSRLSETVQPHTLSIIMDSCGAYVDGSIQYLQDSQYNTLLSSQNTLITQKQELKELEDGVPVEPAPPNIKDVAVAVIKWVIIGGVLGAAVIVMMTWLTVIFSGKITSREKMAGRFSARILGTVHQDEKTYDAITCTIRRLDGRPICNSEENNQFLAANIRNHVGEGKSVLVCSDTSSQVAADLVNTLRSYIPDVTLMAAGNLTNDAAALKLLREADTVIMAVVMNESRVKNIAAALKLVKDTGKVTIGSIVID